MDEKKDIVTLTHAEYDATAELRTVFDDVCDGTTALRAAHVKYLPQFPLEHADDYAARWRASTCLNVTQKTVETMCGLVFQKDITLGDDVPPELVDLCENIDNRGNHLNIFARDLFEDSFDGWSVILVDAPTATAADLGQQRALGLRPYAVAYDACDVINWDYQVNPVSRKTELSLIVLREHDSKQAGRFLREDVTQYRVFYLENGRVFWQLWEEQKDEHGKVVVVQIVDDTAIDKLKQIPCAIVGELGDEPPLMDLAFTNLKYAQKESDYDSILHKTCVPIPYTTGIDASEAGKAISGGLMWHLPKDATIGFAEVAGASIEKVRENLTDLKGDMAMLGLSMLKSDRRANSDVTATEKMLDTIKETSTLQVRAIQLKDAIEMMLGFMAQYRGLESGGSITLGATWTAMVLSSQEIQTLGALVADGSLSLESFLWTLEKADLLPEDITAEDEMKRITDELKTVRPVINAGNMPNESTTQPPPTETQGNTGGTVPN